MKNLEKTKMFMAMIACMRESLPEKTRKASVIISIAFEKCPLTCMDHRIIKLKNPRSTDVLQTKRNLIIFTNSHGLWSAKAPPPVMPFIIC